MKKIIILLITTMLIFAKTYIVSPKESKISFNIKKLGWINVDGEFTKFEGVVDATKKKLETIYGKIDSASVLTDSDKRDKELKAFESMLWVMKHPEIFFETISIDNKTIIANLTIKNITKKITFKVDNLHISDNKVEISISSKISRDDFKVGGFPVLVSDDVKIAGKIVAIKK